LQGLNQLGKVVAPELTTRMAYLYTQITGDSEDDDFARHRGKDLAFDEDELLAKFRANLMLFISICTNHQVEPVLMTQQNRLIESPDPIIKDRFNWFYSAQNVNYTTYKGLYSTFNEEIRTVAKKNDVTCIDLDKSVPAIPEYMYDPIHFRTPGSQYASRVIADEMRKKFQ
jgi:hypothetical protein